jgi:two-component system, cell cycle response regulator DivK
MVLSPSEAIIIVVEDNADNLFIVTDILTADLGVRTVYESASGRQLFALLDRHPSVTPHLILLDLQIPAEDGYEVLRQIRADARLDGVTVIALTANVLPSDINQCRESGFDGFIGKPIDCDRFPHQIEHILQGGSVWEPR